MARGGARAAERRGGRADGEEAVVVVVVVAVFGDFFDFLFRLFGPVSGLPWPPRPLQKMRMGVSFILAEFQPNPLGGEAA